jgi:predicted Zn-dependent peptidase
MTQAPSVQSPLRYPAGLLAKIIGSGSGSRFYWALIDTALADSASLRHDVMDGTGVFYAYISCDPARQEQVLDIATGILRDVRENGVTDDELTTAKNRVSSSISLGGELPMGRLGHLGHNWLYRHEYRSLSEAIERVNAVSQDDIRALLADYPMKVVTIVGLGPPIGGAGQAAPVAG